MSLNVTCCPNCGSTFNFNPRQLESSGGRARCGACLRIFHPAEHLAGPGEEEEPADSVFIGHAPEEYSRTDAPDATGKLPAATQIREKFEILPERDRAAPRQFQPVIQRPQARRFNWGAFVARTTLALMLLVLLAAQILWRKLPDYSQVDWLRPGYALVCARAGCQLPPFSAIDNIESANASLRAHPEHPDAYLLTTRIHNTARFPQVFPVLVLRFTSADGGAIALREFAPAEYLNPDRPTDSLLLPDSPVEIELGVINPAPRTANFEVSFRTP